MSFMATKRPLEVLSLILAYDRMEPSNNGTDKPNDGGGFCLHYIYRELPACVMHRRTPV